MARGVPGSMALVLAVAVCVASIAMMLSPSPVAAEELDLVDLSLEEILSMEVESVSKHAESYFETASSVYVLEHDEIVRSGATRLVDLLQLVPGAIVSELSYDVANATVRGFPEPYSGTILVLLDRVPIQSPASGAFFFERFFIDPEEIERIEVIKGPGGATYGANAVTGVISIFTRSASTQDSKARVETGTDGLFSMNIAGGKELAEGQAIRGWLRRFSHDGYARNPLFDGTIVRVYSKELDQEVEVENRFTLPDNDVETTTMGLSHSVTLGDDVNVESRFHFMEGTGDRYSTFTTVYPEFPGTPIPDSTFIQRERQLRWHLSSRLSHRAGAHQLDAIGSFRREKMRLSILGGVEHDTRTADLEIQDRVRWSRNHELDLGVGARLISFSFDPLYERSWTKVEPGTRRETLFSTHAQDRWQVTEKTSITASAKAEFWSLIGNSAQISAVLRGNYRPTDRTQFWTALSRNLANPSYREVAVEMWVAQVPPYWAYVAGGVPEEMIPTGAGHYLAYLPSEEPDPAKYLTSEGGFRAVLSPRATVETSVFYSRVQDLSIAFNPDLNVLVDSELVDGTKVIPIVSANNTDGSMAGAETILRYRGTDRDMIEVSHSLMVTDLALPDNAIEQVTAPKHQVRLRTYLGLPFRVDLTASALWTSGERNVAAYDYVNQELAPEEWGGVVLEDRNTRWKLDLAVQRSFGSGYLARIWGRNLLTDPYVDSFPDFDLLLYPQTVERTYGVSISYQP
ncbi:MAG: TonB-dependent receptor plug domain-containing protein [Candidatus Eisenbacteria bacterium]|uniref:TonB-dependent receptor plug domain-containing protein n=1 Tax=Eiseniibacteriota bacterium TaxID=2212470 RepID=A0A956SEC8_UNCEI|nr:TonB-dependent receptor plug domain-containing protein [Candidatus Eisenbacteria bacterium]